jgi:hypothetical protein
MRQAYGKPMEKALVIFWSVIYCLAAVIVTFFAACIVGFHGFVFFTLLFIVLPFLLRR